MFRVTVVTAGCRWPYTSPQLNMSTPAESRVYIHHAHLSASLCDGHSGRWFGNGGLVDSPASFLTISPLHYITKDRIVVYSPHTAAGMR